MFHSIIEVKLLVYLVSQLLPSPCPQEKAAAAGRDSDDDLDADMDSQLLQLGKAALKRMRSFNSEQGAAAGGKKKVSAPDLQVSPNPKYPFKLLVSENIQTKLTRGAS